MTVISEWSLPVLILTHEPFSLSFYLLCLAEEGCDGVALVGIWNPAKVSPPQLILEAYKYLRRQHIELNLDLADLD